MGRRRRGKKLEFFDETREGGREMSQYLISRIKIHESLLHNMRNKYSEYLSMAYSYPAYSKSQEIYLAQAATQFRRILVMSRELAGMKDRLRQEDLTPSAIFARVEKLTGADYRCQGD